MDLRTYWNNKISQNCRHHGQLTTISGHLSRQRLTYLLTLLLSYVMWPIQQTRNSVNDCNLFSIASPMQGNKDLHHHFRNSMLSMPTSWSRFQSAISCLHNSCLHNSFPDFRAMSYYPVAWIASRNILLKTSITIYMRWFHTSPLLTLLVHSTLASTSHGRITTKVNGSI